ncbi:type II secretion system protein [bacterium]|nr:type II secretion system protein [bacterium]
MQFGKTLSFFLELRVFEKKFGFTLPELLVTILLISILFSLGVVLTSGLRSTKKMKDNEIAVALAQQAIEVLRSAPFSTIDDADAKEVSVEKDLNSSLGKFDLYDPKFMAGPVNFDRSVEVIDVPSAPNIETPLGLKFVRVIVKWVSPEGGNLSYELTTTIANLN